MLTQEGHEAARECLMRSGLADPIENMADEQHADLDRANVSDMELAHPDSSGDVALRSVGLSRQKKSVDVPPESLERVSIQLLLQIFLVSCKFSYLQAGHQSLAFNFIMTSTPSH